jgi:hypothetical protein
MPQSKGRMHIRLGLPAAGSVALSLAAWPA